ncbi:c-type cytochrome biogenesis protein CcmI, partial [Aeromonas veronii]
TALARWQAMLPLMEKGNPRYVIVERSMEYASAQLKPRGIEVTNSGAAKAGAGEGQPLAMKEGEFPIHVT